MQVIKGNWSSKEYRNGVEGTFELTFAEGGTNKASLTLHYSGAFRTGQSKKIDLEYLEGKVENDHHKWIFRSAEFALDQQFMVTITKDPFGQWCLGYYVCLYPMDYGEFLPSQTKEKQKKKNLDSWRG
jgi:hypothetical protein